jgi:hypothetical protein
LNWLGHGALYRRKSTSEIIGRTAAASAVLKMLRAADWNWVSA